jgi:hypothetical protein
MDDRMCIGPECARKVHSRGYCASHYAQLRVGRPLSVLRPKLRDGKTTAEGRWCPSCRTRKSPSEFWRDQSREDGLANTCSECARASRREAA